MMNIKRITTELCSSSQLCGVFSQLSAHCFGFTAHNFAVLVPPEGGGDQNRAESKVNIDHTFVTGPETRLQFSANVLPFLLDV